ncbi:peptidoglycan/xylan/chitin deacetylase (PgdA/CDA1 family) [Saccharothrix saharensis]|uniref:Peptidoglycan/xylan/chitin deacetylase (PgdA/CDA1 family) n=1 Tax=Saccharothrix saharensis TaxID=571190 RepID=A0A543JKN9_9PSEU|nr:polysaccharide deacetylase family protein [Saccharothrix saharensis]TQM83427.1 peptidoglycan/xylan/chitin deacetylase (PgdA/CDA1 family) [Saccharothrix saharensis]
MRPRGVAVLVAVVAVVGGCSSRPEARQEPPAPVSAAATTTTATTTTAPPTAVPGPGGTTIPVFQQPYAFGTPQRQAPPIVDGMVPVVRRIETDRPYVFITVDDGAVRHPAAAELMRKSGVEPSLFLNSKHVDGYAEYWKGFDGLAPVHAHTATHPDLTGTPYEFQRQEICGNAELLRTRLGARPKLFRPPFGNFDLTTRRAAADCGFTALVMWTAAVNDGVVQFQAGARLNAGDIVLMHFRHTFVEDFLAFLERCKADGLTPVVLDDFLADPKATV